jgi:hypothetical protein
MRFKRKAAASQEAERWQGIPLLAACIGARRDDAQRAALAGETLAGGM